MSDISIKKSPPAPSVSSADVNTLNADVQASKVQLASLSDAEAALLSQTGSLQRDDGTVIRAAGEQTSVTLADGTETTFSWNSANQENITATLANGATASFDSGTAVSGNGAPWNVVAHPDVLGNGEPPPTAAGPRPGSPLEQKQQHDQAGLNWAQRGLKAAQEPQAKGVFAGRSVAQWQQLVQREQALVDGDRNKLTPQVRPTAHQASQLLVASTPQDDPVLLQNARDVVSGARHPVRDKDKAALLISLAPLKANQPEVYNQVLRAIDDTYGSDTAKQVKEALEKKDGTDGARFGNDPVSGKPGWFDAGGAPLSTDKVYGKLRHSSSLPSFGKPNFVTAQSTQAANLLNEKTAFGPAQPGWLADTKDFVAGRKTQLTPDQLGGIGANLAQAKINAPQVYSAVVASLTATYGESLTKGVTDIIDNAPFSWGKNPANGESGWFSKTDSKPKTQSDLHDYFRQQTWPSKEGNATPVGEKFSLANL